MKCKYCGEQEDLCKDNKYIKKNGEITQYYKCRECNTKKCKTYRNGVNGKAAVTKATNEYENKNPERVRAWVIARKIGKAPCEECCDPKTDKHHPDPMQPLAVIHLCRLHHKAAHRNLITNFLGV